MICHEKCNSETAFVDHINRLHNGRDREYVMCDDCGAQFRQKNQLKFVFVFYFAVHYLDLITFIYDAVFFFFKTGYILNRDAEHFEHTNVINVMQNL